MLFVHFFQLKTLIHSRRIKFEEDCSKRSSQVLELLRSTYGVKFSQQITKSGRAEEEKRGGKRCLKRFYRSGRKLGEKKKKHFAHGAKKERCWMPQRQNLRESNKKSSFFSHVWLPKMFFWRCAICKICCCCQEAVWSTYFPFLTSSPSCFLGGQYWRCLSGGWKNPW